MSWEINTFAVTVLDNIAHNRKTGNSFQFVIPKNNQSFGKCLKNFVGDSLSAKSEQTGRSNYNSMGRQRIIEPISGQALDVVI